VPEPKPLPPRAKYITRENVDALRRALRDARETSLLISLDDKEAALKAVHELSRELEGVIISLVYLINNEHEQSEQTVVELRVKRRDDG
jgi:hypothetical protein